MKTNEIVTEGPMDFIKKGIAGAKSAIATNQATRSAAASDQQQTDELKKWTNLLWQSFNRDLSNYKTANGGAMPPPAYVTTWTNQQLPGASNVPAPVLAVPANISDPKNTKVLYDYFLKREAERRHSGFGKATPATPSPATPATPATPSPAIPATPSPAIPATPSPATPATPSPSTPATPATGNIFANSKQLAAAFKEFTASGAKMPIQVRRLLTNILQIASTTPNNPNKPGLTVSPMNKKV